MPHGIKRLRLIIPILIFIVAISGCKSVDATNVVEEAFAKLYPDCLMNESVIFLPAQDQYKGNEYIYLDLKNISQKQIIFPEDFNVKLMTFESGQRNWFEQPNDIQYLPVSSTIIIETSDELLRREVVIIYPVISNSEPVEIRVVVTGFVYENETQTDECVGAFVDITIVP